MEKIIRSKFLQVTPSKEDETFQIIHERDHTVIEAASDVIRIIDQCITPHTPDTKDPDEQELYGLLTRIHFLHNQAYGESESYGILKYWLHRFEKETKFFQYQDVAAIYAARTQEPVQNILIEILKIGQELHKELLAIREPLYILFLAPDEYRNLQKEFHIPPDISAFVDSRTLLLMDYESYFQPDNTKSFYPTIRHELIHILFGQHTYYLPFWVEEGMCEYYSQKYRMDYLHFGLKAERLISFPKIHSEKINYISQLSLFDKIQHVFYPQAASFMDFLFQTLTAKRIWSILKRSSIRRDFFDVLETECKITLPQLQAQWESFIRQYSQNI